VLFSFVYLLIIFYAESIPAPQYRTQEHLRAPFSDSAQRDINR